MRLIVTLISLAAAANAAPLSPVAALTQPDSSVLFGGALLLAGLIGRRSRRGQNH